jgi:hypothetical protein
MAENGGEEVRGSESATRERAFPVTESCRDVESGTGVSVSSILVVFVTRDPDADGVLGDLQNNFVAAGKAG